MQFKTPDLSELMSRYKGLDSQYENDITGDPANLLISFPLGIGNHSDSNIVIRYDELTAICPWTRFPDQGTIVVEYTPDNLLLELKSFKYYLLSFRGEHITQEHLAQKVHEDLREVLAPLRLKVTLDYMPRGGLHTVFVLEM